LVEPGLGVGPPAFRRGLGDVEDAGGLFGGEPDEVPELHELGLLGVKGGEPLECVVEGEELVVLDGGGEVEYVEFDVFGTGPVAEGALASGAVDEDAAHRLGGGGEEVGAVLPVGLGVGAQPEPGLVDEGGGLECLAGRFAGHLLGSHLTQLGVDELEQTMGRVGVAVADRGEDLGHVTHEGGDQGFFAAAVHGNGGCRRDPAGVTVGGSRSGSTSPQRAIDEECNASNEVFDARMCQLTSHVDLNIFPP